MILTTVILLLFLIALIYLFFTWNFGYWRKRGIKEPRALPIMGSYPSVFSQKRHLIFDLDDIYRKYKKDENFVGIYNCRYPQLLIVSPELAHRIFVTDFKHFHDNEASTFTYDSSDFVLSHNPFTLTGSVWKETRGEIVPGLTNNRIKAMYPVTRKVCQKLSEFVKDQIRVPPKDGIDTKDICLRFTSEIVSDCVLGMEAFCFSKKPSPLMDVMKKIFDQSFFLIIYQILIGIAPWIQNIYKLKLVPKKTENFLIELVEVAIKQRSSGDQKLRERTDFLNYIIQLQERKQLATINVVAHITTFLLDGFETTASVITHCLLLLARDQDRMQKLYQEIIKHSDSEGEINFDALYEMPYLDACIHESIRIFPAGLFSIKICTEPIELINKNGHSLAVDKGQVVVVPLMSFMRDEDYYPNPEMFQPERFLQEPEGLKKYREKGLYYGFGNGPRICLGMRFGLTQAKAAIVEIVKTFKVTVNPKTRRDNHFDPIYLLGRLDGGVWLDFQERTSS